MTITDAHSGVPRQEEMSQPVEAGNLEVQDRKQGSLSQVLRNSTTGAGGGELGNAGRNLEQQAVDREGQLGPGEATGLKRERNLRGRQWQRQRK